MSGKKNILAQIFELKIFIPLLVLFLASMYHRIMHIDDAWLAEYAYWLYKTGHVKSELFRGYESYENQIFVCHKLFLFQGALLIKYFGFDLYILKSLGFFYSVLTLIIIFFYLKSTISPKDVKQHFFFILALLLANPVFFLYSFVFRPETNVMALGLLSFYFLNLGLNNSRLPFVLLSALLSGIAVLTHLNAFIFIFAGIFLLFIEKKYIYLICYGVLSSLISVFYFYDVLVTGDIGSFLNQLANDPALESKNFVWSTYIFNFLKEHERFFHSPKEIIFSVLLIIAITSNFRYLISHHNRLIKYTAFLILALSIISHGKTSKYLLIYLPFLCLIITFSIGNMKEMYNKFNVLSVVLVLYFLCSPIFNFDYMNWTTPTESENSQQVMKNIPKGVKVLAPLNLVFNQISNYQFQGLHVYRFFKEKKMYYKDTFNPFLVAQYFNNDYIIMDKEYINYYKLESYTDYSDYKLLSKGSYWIFKSTK